MTIKEAWLQPVCKRQHATVRLECRNEHGIVWAEDIRENTWHDEGEQYMLAACFATNYANYGGALGTLYLGLDCRTAVAESDTLASLLSEPTSADGYQRQSLVTSGDGTSGQDFVISQPSTAYQVLTKTKVFSAATSSWGTIKTAFLCTHATATAAGSEQRLLCTLETTTPRAVGSGELVNAAMTIGISET